MNPSDTIKNSDARAFIANFWIEPPVKIVLSLPANKNEDFQKIVFTKYKDLYQIEQFTATQAFQKSISVNEGLSTVQSFFPEQFSQINLWNSKEEIQIKVSKKGKFLSHRKALPAPVEEKQRHNRQKNYLLPSGTPIAPLIDMGIFTAQGRVVDAMQHKYRQINRFLEMVDDCLPFLPKDHTLNIIDFGCGKSYLTFVLYYYFTQIKNLSVNITGLDLKKDVIEKCNLTAQKYGYDQLHFLQGDIKDHKAQSQIDMVISLHACDTATDYALFYAINNKAKAILAVPCCQHELNKQMTADNLSILTRYGLVKERTAALMTDAIRGNLLAACGYKSQLLEFIDMEHTPKNILIRAMQGNLSKESKKSALNEVQQLCEAFSFKPSLLTLLQSNGYLSL